MSIIWRDCLLLVHSNCLWIKPAADKSNSLENKKLQLEPATGLNYSGNRDNVMLQMSLSVDLYCNLKLLCARQNIQESTLSLAQKRKRKRNYSMTSVSTCSESESVQTAKS